MAAQDLSDPISCSSVREHRSQRDGTASTIYAPLVSTESQIRLLKLQPGQFDEDIRCSLHIVSLNSDPQYEALSYVWGDANITLPVIVDGEVIQSTTNLEAALRHLRSREKPRILWVDAICINQKDIDEKNVQLPLMGKIYRNSTSVVAWFGHGFEPVESAITWIQFHMLHQTDYESLEWRDLGIIAAIEEEGEYLKFVRFASASVGCLHIFQHHYWRRMWTFQEFVLPRKLPICVYGHYTFSMSKMYDAFDTLDHYVRSFRPAAEAIHKDETQIVWDLINQETIGLTTEISAQYLQQLINDPAKLAFNLAVKGPRALDYLLHITADRKSYDPRDRIYALYGLFPALSEEFPADYSKSEKQVILEAISYVVRVGCTFLWLRFGLRADRFSSKAFPSWCPDFGRPNSFFRPTRPFEAFVDSSSSMGTDRISADLTTFHLWSWNLGFCKVLGRIDIEIDSQSESLRWVKEFWAFLKSLKAQDNATAHDLQLRFARCAVSYLEGQDEVSNEELLEVIEAVSNDPNDLESEDGKGVVQARRMISLLQWKRDRLACVFTSHGCVAFAPVDTEDNDLMVSPRQPEPPTPTMVLRKEHANSSHGNQEFYLMVGPARLDLFDSREDHEVNVASKIREFGAAEYMIH